MTVHVFNVGDCIITTYYSLFKLLNKNWYKIIFDKLEKCYVFNIVPSFEYKDSPESVSEGACGIYRYRDKSGNIIYIGRGNIKERLRSPE